MLAIQRKNTARNIRIAVSISAVVLLMGGVYIASLVAAPALAPALVTKPINVKDLPAPVADANRLIIPKLGIDIAYDTGAAALDRGAEWRSPDSGNPADGGNFVIAAHRLSIQPTPMGTIIKSPFYNIASLQNGDKILVDYQGKRYGYQVTKEFSVHPSQIAIEARTTDPIMTLYSCSLSGAEADRFVLQAERLGEVAVTTN